MIDKAVLQTDGGSRGNPGPSGIGYEIYTARDGVEVTLSDGGAYIGEATNNIAEYQALIWGLQNALALGVKHLSVRADSELMIKQIKGEYKVKNEGIKPLFLEVIKALRVFDSYDVCHVYREDNKRADALANEAMDSKQSVGSYTVPCKASSGESGEDEVTTGLFAQGALSAEAAKEPSAQVKETGSTQAQETSSTSAQTKKTGVTTMATGTYTLAVKNHFDAAHALVGYPGECRELHGHTWDVEAIVSGTELDEVGIIYDFKSLKADLAAILDDFDHKYLNEVPPFNEINATAENLARVVYERLEENLPDTISLDEVSVWESPIAKLTYTKKENKQ